VNKYSGPAFAAALLLLSTGCASHHASAAADAATTTAGATATTATTADAAAATTTSDEKPGAGHVSITGEYALEHDFVVDACQIAPAGDGLLAGYHMGIKSDGPPIALISIALKDFAKDGRYEEAATTREATLGQAMRTGTMGPLTLMVMADATRPLSFGQVPSSTLSITITNDGAKGTAEFTNLESQISMADIDPSSSTPPHGKRVSGSISWTCGTVGRIDPHMNDAVNGMFKKLIPPK
jgi:hypothetical protein